MGVKKSYGVPGEFVPDDVEGDDDNDNDNEEEDDREEVGESISGDAGAEQNCDVGLGRCWW